MLIVPREFTNADIGLILYKFGEFLNLTPSEAIMYFHRFVIIVTRKLAGHNMSTFKKFVSPYDKSVSNKPKMYNEIIELFDKMNI